jgi:hypothetical protein
MNTTQPQRNCPICSEDYLSEAPESLQYMDGKRYHCRRCGYFDLDNTLVETRNARFERARHLVSAWVIRQNKSGIAFPVVGKGMDLTRDDWPLQFEHMGFPSTVNEKLDALLLAYADMTSPLLRAQLDQSRPHLISEVAARDSIEVRGLTELLEELGYIAHAAPDGHKLLIAGKGWLHIDELRQRKSASDSAFIAMWFDACTKEYREAAIAAVEYCGYRTAIVDQEDFNGFIMDRVVALIRESRFVVADFTCGKEIDEKEKAKVQQGIRGGVYWEAGMAYGMNKPVIHTCKDSDEARRRMHFDVEQYRTIFWQDEQLGAEIRDMSGAIQNPNLAEKLVAHILGTVGKGSYVPEKR